MGPVWGASFLVKERGISGAPTRPLVAATRKLPDQITPHHRAVPNGAPGSHDMA